MNDDDLRKLVSMISGGIAAASEEAYGGVKGLTQDICEERARNIAQMIVGTWELVEPDWSS